MNLKAHTNEWMRTRLKRWIKYRQKKNNDEPTEIKRHTE